MCKGNGIRRKKGRCPNSSEGEYNSFGISRRYVCLGMSIVQIVQCNVLIFTYPFRDKIIRCTHASDGIDSLVIQYGKSFTIHHLN